MEIDRAIERKGERQTSKSEIYTTMCTESCAGFLVPTLLIDAVSY